MEFSFIGYGPEGTDNLGGCTQMAVFKKLPSIEIDGNFYLLSHLEIQCLICHNFLNEDDL